MSSEYQSIVARTKRCDQVGLAAILVDCLYFCGKTEAIQPAGQPVNDIAVALIECRASAADRRQGDQLLHQLGAPLPNSVRSTGGGAANAAWTRIRGQLMEVPMLTPDNPEAAFGAARLARQGAL